MHDAQHLARIFKALAVDTRVRMVLLLKERSLCVNALATSLAVTPAAISQHLRILRDANLVIAEKRGFFVHYRLNHETMTQWKALAETFLTVSGEQGSQLESNMMPSSSTGQIRHQHCRHLRGMGATEHETSDDSHRG